MKLIEWVLVLLAFLVLVGLLVFLFGFAGKVHKKTQVVTGFYRGAVMQGQVTRFSRKTFANGEDAELYMLAAMMRVRGIQTATATHTPPPTPPHRKSSDGEGSLG